MSEKNKSVEEKMETLRAIVAWFESDDFSLEKATAQYENAAVLAAEIDHDLTEVKNTITVLKKKFST